MKKKTDNRNITWCTTTIAIQWFGKEKNISIHTDECREYSKTAQAHTHIKIIADTHKHRQIYTARADDSESESENENKRRIHNVRRIHAMTNIHTDTHTLRATKKKKKKQNNENNNDNNNNKCKWRFSLCTDQIYTTYLVHLIWRIQHGIFRNSDSIFIHVLST